MKISVLYHKNCWDGFCAAWLLYNVFDNEAEYIPVQYGEDPPEINGEKVFIVDFSYKRNVMLKLKQEHPDLIVLDHHKSAKAELEGLDYCTFDMAKSGARLTYEYIQKNYPFVFDRALFKPQWLVDYTEDRDLWRHKLPNTKEINAAMRIVPLDFEVWDGLQFCDLEKLTDQGVAILKAESMLVHSAVGHAIMVEFVGGSIPLVNATNMISEIGNALCKEGHGFSLSYFIQDIDTVVFSMRSAGAVDVSEIAVKFGGGGHPGAAGFKGDLTMLSEIFQGEYGE